MDEPEYHKASVYWSKIPATVDGMLGGLSRVSGADISFSDRILSKFLKGEKPMGNELALDVGAGIGRVSKHLLAKHFQRLHMLEADQHFVEGMMCPHLLTRYIRIFRVFVLAYTALQQLTV